MAVELVLHCGLSVPDSWYNFEQNPYFVETRSKQIEIKHCVACHSKMNPQIPNVGC